ncbi:MAG: hypothetical protein HY923_07790 [Elusimicrobia bacterium]|nr:hypothetical protein [Elusimicrobiota bacterium]
MRKLKTSELISIAAVALFGLIGLRSLQAVRAKRDADCRALAKALDKTIREKTPRVFEGILGHRWNRETKRCLASLEYHYKPCDAKERTKNPEACDGPDADVAIYAFLDGGARPLLICERTYATGAAYCSQSVYGIDGTLLTTQEIPPDQFPAVKAGLLGVKP